MHWRNLQVGLSFSQVGITLCPCNKNFNLGYFPSFMLGKIQIMKNISTNLQHVYIFIAQVFCNKHCTVTCLHYKQHGRLMCQSGFSGWVTNRAQCSLWDILYMRKIGQPWRVCNRAHIVRYFQMSITFSLSNFKRRMHK